MANSDTLVAKSWTLEELNREQQGRTTCQANGFEEKEIQRVRMLILHIMTQTH